jgi:hypothetical protein
MDEYLFMTLAKLKADRLKLEREQRAGAPAASGPPCPSQLRLDWAEPVDTHRHSARWFSQQPPWREQS